MKPVPDLLHRGMISHNHDYYGWPTLAYRDGRLLAVASRRIEHLCPFGRIELHCSGDGGQSWELPELLAQGKLDYRDPSIFVSPTGHILVGWTTSISWLRYWSTSPNCPEMDSRDPVARRTTLYDLLQEWGTWMIRSADGGNSWSKAYRIPVYAEHGPMAFPDGRLGMVGHESTGTPETIHGGSWIGSLAFAQSCDDGRSWEIVSRIRTPAFPELAFNEPAAIQADNGRLVVVARNDGPGGQDLWQLDSWDAGRSWSLPHRIGPGLPPHLLKRHDGSLLLSYGCRDYHGGKNSIRARLSTDHGGSWSEEFMLADDFPSPDMGYPSTVELADGTLFTLWYANCRTWDESDRWTGTAPFLHHLHWSLS